jgi:RNA polymerase subunit RPABC4/transcription elongation factor Spt4
VMTACPSCGIPAGADDRFCGRCGSTLTASALESPTYRFCTACGAGLEEDDRFCPRCGQPSRPPETGPPSASSHEDEEDLLADWEVEVPDEPPPPPPAPPRRDEAVTEQVPRTPRPSDTAVIERHPDLPVAPAPYVPPPRPAREPREPPRGFPFGATFALIGAVAVIVSAVLEWRGPFGQDLPRDIAFRLLFDPQGPATGPNLGVVLLGVGTLGALVALLTMAVPILRLVRRLVGLITLAIPAGFAVRTFQVAVEDGRFLDLPSLLGPGVYVAAAGAFVQMVAGRWSRR